MNPSYDLEMPRKKKKSVRKDLVIFVLLPTLVAAIYYFLMAADVYVSESKFSVNVEGNNMGFSPLAALLPAAVSNASNQHEAAVVKEFIMSTAMIEKLKTRINLQEIYDNGHADLFSRIPKDLKIERYREKFNNKVELVIDDITGIATLKVRAYSPQEAKKLADTIVIVAEEFVNSMTARVQQDSVKFSQEEVAKSEKMVVDINQRISDLRTENKNYDPNATTTGILGINAKLEADLAATNTEMTNLKNYMQPASPRIKALENKAQALRQQIETQTARIAGDNDGGFSNVNDEYASLVLQRQFAMKRLEITLTGLETAQADAIKKRRYLLRIVEPTLPQSATEPRKLREVLTVFFAFLTIYTFGGLIIAAIRDHIRP